MRNCAFEHGNLYKILLGCLSTLCNSSGNLTSLTKSISNDTLAITNNNDGSERESTTTFCNLGYTVDCHQAIL